MKTARLTASILVVFALLGSVSAAAEGLQDDVDQAVNIIQRFQAIPEKAIPPAVLRDARGLAIMTVLKAGFIVSGRGGSGVVIARTKKGWSGPSAIGTGGAGFGFQIGGQVSEFVIVLNTLEPAGGLTRPDRMSSGVTGLP